MRHHTALSWRWSDRLRWQCWTLEKKYEPFVKVKASPQAYIRPYGGGTTTTTPLSQIPNNCFPRVPEASTSHMFTLSSGHACVCLCFVLEWLCVHRQTPTKLLFNKLKGIHNVWFGSALRDAQGNEFGLCCSFSDQFNYVFWKKYYEQSQDPITWTICLMRIKQRTSNLPSLNLWIGVRHLLFKLLWSKHLMGGIFALQKCQADSDFLCYNWLQSG